MRYLFYHQLFTILLFYAQIRLKKDFTYQWGTAFRGTWVVSGKTVSPQDENIMTQLTQFNRKQIRLVNEAAEMSEELVSNFYKMSASQWLHRRYDIKTLSDLKPEEIIHGPFAQIMRYEGKHKDTSLGSSTYDFYMICVQDHAICNVLDQSSQIRLLPFALYIISHELIHIVRFTKFLQGFDVPADEKMAEESRVHKTTQAILKSIRLPGMPDVLEYYNKWHRHPTPI